MNSSEAMEKIAALTSRVSTLERTQAGMKLLFTLETAPLMRESLNRGNFEEVEVLLQSGFDPTWPITSDKWNVFLFLVQAGKHQCVEAILSAGEVNVDYQDSDGFSALHIAAGKGDLEMVKVLLKHGASFDPVKFSALRIANGANRLEVAYLLRTEASRRRNANLCIKVAKIRFVCRTAHSCLLTEEIVGTFLYMATSSFSSRRNPFSNRSHETIVSAPGSLQGADISLDTLNGCDVFIMDNTAAIYVDECVDCTIRIGPVAGFCYFRDCSNCILSVACQQFRSKNCHGMTVFLYSASDPHIELCKDVTFGPYNFAYPLQDKHFKAAGLNPQANLWSQVYDHTPSNSEEQNWLILEPKDFTPIAYRIDELGEPIDPVTKPSMYSVNGEEGIIVHGSQMHKKPRAPTPSGIDNFQPAIIQEEDQGKLADVDLDLQDNEATYMPQDWEEHKVVDLKAETSSGWEDVIPPPKSGAISRLDLKQPLHQPFGQHSSTENPLLKDSLTAGPPALEGEVQASVLYTKEKEFLQELEAPGNLQLPEHFPLLLERASSVARPYHEELRMLMLSGFCVLFAGLMLLLALVLVYDFVKVDDGGLAIQLFLLVVATVGLLVYIFVRMRRTLARGNQDLKKVLEEETVTTYNQCDLAFTGDLFSVHAIAKPKKTLQALLR